MAMSQAEAQELAELEELEALEAEEAGSAAHSAPLSHDDLIQNANASLGALPLDDYTKSQASVGALLAPRGGPAIATTAVAGLGGVAAAEGAAAGLKGLGWLLRGGAAAGRVAKSPLESMEKLGKYLTGPGKGAAEDVDPVAGATRAPRVGPAPVKPTSPPNPVAERLLKAEEAYGEQRLAELMARNAPKSAPAPEATKPVVEGLAEALRKSPIGKPANLPRRGPVGDPGEMPTGELMSEEMQKLYPGLVDSLRKMRVK